MKYAKKMRLVDIDDAVSQQPNQLYQARQSDDKFLAPRTLSILDSSMNDILSCGDIPDSEKWMLYNQTLQKFLNHMRYSRKPVIPQPQHVSPKIDQRNQSVNTFDGHISDNTMNGVVPIRDSLDHITQQNVRDFFQQMRNNGVNNKDISHSSPVAHPHSSLSSVSPIQTASLPASPVYARENNSTMNMDYQSLHSSSEMSIPQQPQKKNTPTRAKSPLRRGTKRGCIQNISCVPPRKVRPQSNMEPTALFRQRPATRTNNELYWEATNAR